jgi:Tfp pilus assembly protein PilO
MMLAISTRERWLIAVAVTAAVLIGSWVWILEPQLDKNRATAELIPVRLENLAKRRQLVSQQPILRRDLIEMSRQVETITARLLRAATPPVAASELQKLVKDVATEAGLEVRSERILPPVERGDLLEIPVEIAVAGGVRELVGMLYGLDGSPKLLAVQDVKIRVVSVGQPKELLTTLTLSGFILPRPLGLRAS